MEKRSGDRCKIHLFCLAVRAAFSSSVVECWGVTQRNRGQDPARTFLNGSILYGSVIVT